MRAMQDLIWWDYLTPHLAFSLMECELKQPNKSQIMPNPIVMSNNIFVKKATYLSILVFVLPS